MRSLRQRIKRLLAESCQVSRGRGCDWPLLRRCLPIIPAPHVTPNPIESSVDETRPPIIPAPHASPTPVMLWRREGVLGTGRLCARYSFLISLSLGSRTIDTNPMRQRGGLATGKPLRDPALRRSPGLRPGPILADASGESDGLLLSWCAQLMSKTL
jgi:hypothetical protein